MLCLWHDMDDALVHFERINVVAMADGIGYLLVVVVAHLQATMFLGTQCHSKLVGRCGLQDIAVKGAAAEAHIRRHR